MCLVRATVRVGGVDNREFTCEDPGDDEIKTDGTLLL